MKKTIIYWLLFLLSGVTALAAKPNDLHVVYIGLDGWGSYSLPKAEMPAVKSLMAEGCYTLKKRAVLPSSSAVNWASMFMGAGPELHGYTEWGSKTPELPSRVVLKNNIFPTVFQLLREERPEAEIGVMSEWDGIMYLVDTLSTNCHAVAPDYNQHPTALCEMAEKYIIDKKPTLLAICFDNPDHVGHDIGHDTPEYYNKLTELDGYIARIIRAVEQAGILKQTVFIVTSDHGGIEKGHGGKTLAETETPLIIAGKGVLRRGELTESIVQYDVAATIAALFRLKQPQVWTGRAISLKK